MRRFHRLSTILALTLVFMAPGAATAEFLKFRGVHTMEFEDFDVGAVVSATGSGVAIVNGSAGAGHLNTLELTRNFATLNTVFPVTDPVVTAAGAVELRLEGLRFGPDIHGGVFAPISRALQNTAVQLTRSTMPLVGTVRYCIFYAGCNSGALTQTLGGTVNGLVLDGTGVGGLLTIGASGPLRISMLAAPWTLRTVSFSKRTNNLGITFHTARGFAHGPLSLTSSTGTTNGVVQLVTATQITTLGMPGNNDKDGRLAELTLHFTPEPGLLLLLASGGAGIAVLGARRRPR